jgi:hypothetical protein
LLAQSQFGRTAELDALYVRPKGELHGWSESKNERKGTPMNPPFGSVRSFGTSGPRLNSLRYTPLRQTPLFPRIFLHSLTGFKGD